MSDLLYSDVEEQLRSSVRDLLGARAPLSGAVARAESGRPYDASLWTALARDLGVAGLAVPENAGGHGGSWREIALVAEELGRAVAATPFLGSAVLATAAAMDSGSAELVGALAAGTSTAALVVPLSTPPGSAFPDHVRFDGTLASGQVCHVADAAGADLLLVPAAGPDGPVLLRVEAGAARCEPVTSLDLTRPLSDVHLDAAAGSVIAGGDDAVRALEAALLAGATVLAAEQVGLAEHCLDSTVAYLKERYQFGRQIGSFQALKHRCADLWANIAQARAVARYAAACLADGTADGTADAPVAAALAQAYCSPLAVTAAEECIQLHGGIGFTWEHPAHLYLKRAKADSIAFGGASRHHARLGELVDLPA